MIKLEYKRKRKISHKTHLYFSDPTPQHTHTSSLDSCTARETDCCHSNYICAQLGMCFCASASASPWSSTNRPRAPREGREKHVCRRQGTRQDGSPDTNHVLALFSPKPFPSKSQVTGYYQDPKSKPQKISQKDASEVNVQSPCGQIQETKRTWEVWLGRRHKLTNKQRQVCKSFGHWKANRGIRWVHIPHVHSGGLIYATTRRFNTWKNASNQITRSRWGGADMRT